MWSHCSLETWHTTLFVCHEVDWTAAWIMKPVQYRHVWNFKVDFPPQLKISRRGQNWWYSAVKKRKTHIGHWNNLKLMNFFRHCFWTHLCLKCPYGQIIFNLFLGHHWPHIIQASFIILFLERIVLNHNSKVLSDFYWLIYRKKNYL